ncbi:MAG: hypothetical protein KBC00_01195 [Candidatus Levybacteria bacterium]|nr:hypothetical protein [Candidatus Levybacteria bacterium]MBP9814952.1 hypothetical protein [Candidatus Levybacteria bacterium]
MEFESGASDFFRMHIGEKANTNIRGLYIESNRRINESSPITYLAGRFMEASREGLLRADAELQKNRFGLPTRDDAQKLYEYDFPDYLALFFCSTIIEADSYRQTGIFSTNSLLTRFNYSISGTAMAKLDLQENIYIKPGREDHKHFKDEWEKDPTYTEIMLNFSSMPEEFKDYMNTKKNLKESMQILANTHWRQLAYAYLLFEKSESSKKESTSYTLDTEDDLKWAGFSENSIKKLLIIKEKYRKKD